MSDLSHQAYIGLGSNLDTPAQHIEQAIVALGQLPLTQLIAASPCYTSKPVGPQDQPDFVNATVHLSTRLSPLALLDQLQALEQRHRRQRLRHWGPRTLDLDLLLFDDCRLDSPRLTIPHPAMHERGFVLVPLAKIAPHLIIADQHIDALLARLDTSDLQPLAP